ncbi:uncharacterized protein DFL_000830 [Arthrobotrys flagrans]|uniref:Uncharacterized protein n=1 Tax=Arthrobotrys flagrans TaxID=97331 RepID=A0A437AFL4_ARTFL|nr:hypothetical protein DFL_000830 [Arthrobotrys flagrans]
MFSPRNVEFIQSYTPDPSDLAEGAFVVPSDLRALSGLIWSKLGFRDAIWWYPSAAASLINRERVRAAVVAFREMKESKLIKLQQFISVIEANSLPVKFQLVQPPLLQHFNEVSGTEDDQDPTFWSERTSKRNIILLLLQLLAWREAACRLGRESSITSTIIEIEDSWKSTAFDDNEAPLNLANKGNNASSNSKHAAETSLQSEKSPAPKKTSKDKGRKRIQSAEKRRGIERNDGDGGDDDDDGARPLKKRRRKGPVKALGGQLACPFAKAEPALYLRCVTIGRKDLSGVK